jgi:S-adenosylmethionine:tRNA ribosyltransferase-isomerase
MRIADAPIESTGRRRDDVRLLVASPEGLRDTTFSALPGVLRGGDLVVVNTSATLPAAIPAGEGLVVHLSTEQPGGFWVLELRAPCGTAGTKPFPSGWPGASVPLPGGGRVDLLAPFPAGTDVTRLWLARLDLPTDVGTYLHGAGRPIRYGCTDTSWPIADYQTVFATDPGSAEMPSAGRAFTPELVTALVVRGIEVAPITLHTGVSSQEAGEPPYAERYRVTAATAARVNAARADGRRVIAVGTTVTRALETVADEHGVAHPGAGWTDLVVTPERGVRLVDGLLTGWHEPAASHLQLLEAVAGRDLVKVSYERAELEDYAWHEFGDLHLVLP